MITEETLFILGAGASVPYGLPTGADLRYQLSRISSVEDDLAQKLYRCADIEPPELVAFSNAFLKSRTASIDTFLATREQYVHVGKNAIAAVLIRNENPDLIHNSSPKDNWDDWYSLLWSVMREGASRPLDIAQHNKVKFVTFNYDRSLEYFLHHAIKESYGTDDATAESIWGSMGILHIYGQLGRYSHGQAADVRWYSPELTGRDLQVAAEGINIIPESRDNAKPFLLARNWLGWAKRICFLGFGFDALNVKRLDFLASILAEPKHHKRVVASMFGMERGEAVMAQRRLFGEEFVGEEGQHIFAGQQIMNWEHHVRVNSKTLRASRLFV